MRWVEGAAQEADARRTLGVLERPRALGRSSVLATVSRCATLARLGALWRLGALEALVHARGC
jgi:hypothetical protein